MVRWVFLFFFPLLVMSSAARSEDSLAGLRAGHPRLFVPPKGFPSREALLGRDPLALRLFTELQQNAESILAEPVVERGAGRILERSRDALRRISTLAGVFRLTGDRRFLERARAEMLAAAAFPDWSPEHFLDLAEMTAALALGYDWLYGELDENDRGRIRKAIHQKGLKEGLKIYARPKGWHKARHNWNLVCNGGLVLGALAIAEDEPATARDILAAARASVPVAMRSFSPDGGWEEGPGYWNYATLYNALLLASLESALGTDWGLSGSPGFSETGHFWRQIVATEDRAFNFADASERAGPAPQMFWLARRFGRPGYTSSERAFLQRRGVRGHRLGILELLWLEPDSGSPPLESALFRGVHVAFLRGAADDPGTAYVGFKGGANDGSHSHLDLGSFVFEAQGVRWAVDLGPDDYELPGYFEPEERWTYYRVRTEGHNTLTFGEAGSNQEVSASAPIIAFSSAPARAFAVADLSEAYRPTVLRATRGVALLDGRSLLVQDEFEAAEPVTVRWNMHTRASVWIEPRGRRAVLRRKGKSVFARILSPPAARFEAITANPPPPQTQQPEVKNLTVVLDRKERTGRIAVLLSSPDGEYAQAVLPLADWGGALEKQSR